MLNLLSTRKRISRDREGPPVCIFENEFRAFGEVELSKLDFKIFVSSQKQRHVMQSYGYDVEIDENIGTLIDIQNTEILGKKIGYIPGNEKIDKYVREGLKEEAVKEAIYLFTHCARG
jgi:hypothetical protein